MQPAPLFISLFSLMLTPVWGDYCGMVRPGNPAKKISEQGYTSSVMEAMQNYVTAVRKGEKEQSATARKEAIKAIRQHPDEVNDYITCCENDATTPLSQAILLNDAEIVELLLEQGAYPALPSSAAHENAHGLFDQSPLQGESYDERIVKKVSQAASNLEVFELLLHRDPSKTAASPTAPELLPPEVTPNGFSRAPVLYYNKNKLNLVHESLTASPGEKSPRFRITEYKLLPFNAAFYVKHWEITQDTGKLSHIRTVRPKRIAPGVYREYLSNGNCMIYKLEMNYIKELKCLRTELYDIEDKLIDEEIIYDSPLQNADPQGSDHLPDVPLIVEAPTSEGVNQGFSRLPSPPFYDAAEHVLVFESIGKTSRVLSSGNNTRFIIREFYIHPDARCIIETSREILEGSSRIVNTQTNAYPATEEPCTYRREYEDGTYALYKAEHDHSGCLNKLTFSYTDSDGQPHECILYENKKNSLDIFNGLHLIVDPPVSGENGAVFSREPAEPCYDSSTHILTIERLGRRDIERPDGRNLKFSMQEYLVQPNGSEMKIGLWYIVEGEDSPRTQYKLTLPQAGNDTYREELGLGNYCLYQAEFSPEGELTILRAIFYTPGNQRAAEAEIYKKPQSAEATES